MRNLRSGKDGRMALTIIELLVTIAVAAMLLAVLLPAIQQVRESGYRTVCANNLKQIGLAFYGHQEKHGVLPDAGRYWGDSRSKNANGIPEVTPKQDWGCWYQILPYLDHAHAWANPDDLAVASTIVPLYFCPSRRRPVGYPGIETNGLPAGGSYLRGALDYAGSGGTSNQAFPSGAPNFADRKNGAIVPRKNVDHFAVSDIPDGASNTLLASERNVNMKRAGDWRQLDENNGYFNGWDWDTMRWADDPPAPDRWDDSSWDLRFGSSHRGGLNMLFADGSVRFMFFTLELRTFQLLSDRDDGQVLNAEAWR